VTLGSLKLSGNEFQADRPATEKAHWPYVTTFANGDAEVPGVVAGGPELLRRSDVGDW